MRKQISLRRWKRRCALGRVIPAYAIIDHQLDRWFRFEIVSVNADVYRALK